MARIKEADELPERLRVGRIEGDWAFRRLKQFKVEQWRAFDGNPMPSHLRHRAFIERCHWPKSRRRHWYIVLRSGSYESRPIYLEGPFETADIAKVYLLVMLATGQLT